jgi:hypothetical protein
MPILSSNYKAVENPIVVHGGKTFVDIREFWPLVIDVSSFVSYAATMQE